MYHTFQAQTTNPSEGGDGAKGARGTGSRRISTSNACGSCRRRKIRCDGQTPCGQCIWYQQSDSCVYQKPTQRVIPSRKLIDKLSTSMEQYQAVFNRLFPDNDIAQISSLSREELMAVLGLPATAQHIANTVYHNESPDATPKSTGAESLEELAQAPEQDPASDEAKRHQARIQGISDDVNGLSLSVDRPSSYVGASSITAALKVVFKVAPAARRLMILSQNETALPSRAGSPSPNSQISPDPSYLPSPELGHVLIESYFDSIHPLMPMIDEQQFWHTWLYGERKDAAWLALLNTVLALGSVASSESGSNQHIAYFQRAMQHLNIDSLGSGNLLVVQALGLLSGYYLHYVNRPNLANNLMGATLRQATVLGLHREYADRGSNDGNLSTEAMSADVRRRTWWSLFVLDTWANTTTGRPSLGHLGRGITVHLPEIKDAQNQASIKLLPLINNVSFCKLATRIQDALSATPLLRFEELGSLDAELMQWHNDLPSVLQPQTVQEGDSSADYGRTLRFSVDEDQQSNRIQPNRTCPDILRTPRTIMHWRYQNLRLLLHRPYLLATALRKVPFTSLSAEEKVGVGRCRAIASKSISDISGMCEEELIAGWNAVWFMYQAVMVPLVSLFSVLSTSKPSINRERKAGATMKAEVIGTETEPTDHNASNEGKENVRDWEQQIEKALRFFDRMGRWSVAAKKSRDVVARLYDASKQLGEHSTTYQPHTHTQAQDQPQPESFQLDSTGSLYGVDNTEGANELNFQANHLPSFVPDANTGMTIEGTWGLSPNGAAAMNNFWFDEMMWDLPPTGPEMPSGTGFGSSELDWLSTFGGHDGDAQTWYRLDQDPGPG